MATLASMHCSMTAASASGHARAAVVSPASTARSQPACDAGSEPVPFAAGSVSSGPSRRRAHQDATLPAADRLVRACAAAGGAAFVLRRHPDCGRERAHELRLHQARAVVVRHGRQLLPAAVGRHGATSEPMLTGASSTPRALATGLVSASRSDAKLSRRARSLIDEMLATPPIGLRMTKDGLSQAINASSLKRRWRSRTATSSCAQSPDFAEIARLLEKRKPVYST